MKTSLLIAVVLLVTVPSPAPATHGFDRDCGDFASQSAAQYHLNSHPGDPDGLDGDRDGVACETSRCPCYHGRDTAPAPVYALPTPTPTPAPTATPARPPAGKTYRAKIVRVVDGDTLQVRLRSGGRKTVRLLGIDSPEKGRPGVGVECGARRASAHMTGLAFRRRGGRRSGQNVLLRTDPTQARTDRFGRLLAYATRTAGSLDLGKAMIRAGWATTYVYDGIPFQRAGAYAAVEAQAKSAGRGVYGTCAGDFHSQQP